MKSILRFTVLVCFSLGLFQPVFSQTATVRVLMSTSLGEIEIELYPANAPLTVENFLRHVDGQHLDGGSFYRTVTYDNDNGSPKIEVIQGGLNAGPAPFPPITHESTEITGLKHLDGTISMSRGGVGTASSEFFICIGDQPGLDHGQPRNADGQGFAAFGKVLVGMEVVRAINQQATRDDSDSAYTRGQQIAAPVRIESVRRM